MKSITQIGVAIVASGLMLTSCVSSKKYNEALGSAENAESRYTALADDHKNLQRAYDKLQEEKNTLAELTSEALLEKERELQEREKKVAELKAIQQAQRDAVAALKQEVCSALKCFTPDELQVDVRDGKLYVSMSDKLLFPSGSAQINSRGDSAIQMLSAVLGQSDLEIMIEGHTDDVPISTAKYKDNWDLSVHRATTVTRMMVDNGIDPQRIIAGGQGEYSPIASNETKEGRKKNRRTEIVLAPKLDKLWELTEDDETANN